MITPGKHQVTIEQLRSMTTTMPENAGSRYQPIPHKDLVQAFYNEFEDRGWQVLDEWYATGNNHQNFAGAIRLHAPQINGLDNFYASCICVGFTNSNDRRGALKVYGGVVLRRVEYADKAPCGGTCLNEMPVWKAHDNTVDIQADVHESLNTFEEKAAAMPSTIERMSVPMAVTHDQAAYIIMQLGHSKLVGWAAVGRVYAKYRDYYDRGVIPTAWGLYSVICEVIAPNVHPTKQMATQMRIKDLINNTVLSTV